MIIIIASIVISAICYACYKWNVGKIKVHVHSYSHPIVSKYVGFNTRDIIYECRCGKRKIIREYRPFNKPFPIKTTSFITNKDLERIVNNEKTYLDNQSLTKKVKKRLG
jgi:hypothetical protein